MISYSEFKESVKDREDQGDDDHAESHLGREGDGKWPPEISDGPGGGSGSGEGTGSPPCEIHRKDRQQMADQILSWIIPLVFFFFIWRILFSRIGPETGVMSFGKSRAKIYAEKDKKITFADVAGIDEAKEELKEIVEFLKNPGKVSTPRRKDPQRAFFSWAHQERERPCWPGPWPERPTSLSSPSAVPILWKCLSASERPG